jgi:hypothetical protein
VNLELHSFLLKHRIQTGQADRLGIPW